MPLATKSNAIIIKDGKVAESCGCCDSGACCESNGTCSVKPESQCQGAGKTFKGVGTVCTGNPCSLCDLPSISISTTGTAQGFYAASFVSYLCPDQQYSVSASGSGTLTKDQSQLLGRSLCRSGGVGKCAYAGDFAIGNGAKLNVVLVFFTVGNDIRYAVYSYVLSYTAAAIAACGPAPIGQSYIGAIATYEGCSSVIGTSSASGGLPVNLNNVPPLVTEGKGYAADAELGFSAMSGAITFSFNPLP